MLYFWEIEENKPTGYSAEELKRLAPLWLPAMLLRHDDKAAAYRLPDGSSFTVSRRSITAPATLSHDWLRASMAHVAAEWQGRASIPFDENEHQAGRELRLWARAYADVYGIELRDANETVRGWTADELARLSSMRAEVRERHQDAPQERPGEAAELAEAYSRRHPFHAPRGPFPAASGPV